MNSFLYNTPTSVNLKKVALSSWTGEECKYSYDQDLDSERVQYVSIIEIANNELEFTVH